MHESVDRDIKVSKIANVAPHYERATVATISADISNAKSHDRYRRYD